MKIKNILIMLFAVISSVSIVLKNTIDEGIQNIQLRQKQFEETHNKQMASIKQKQDELIQIYDFIISNKTERIESK